MSLGSLICRFWGLTKGTLYCRGHCDFSLGGAKLAKELGDIVVRWPYTCLGLGRLSKKARELVIPFLNQFPPCIGNRAACVQSATSVFMILFGGDEECTGLDPFVREVPPKNLYRLVVGALYQVELEDPPFLVGPLGARKIETLGFAICNDHKLNP